jgi:hypothetical protein
LLLVGDSPAPGPYADFYEANVIYLRVFDYGDSYGSQLRYKLNKPNSSIYGPFATTNEGGLAATAYMVPSMLGTWGVTFQGTQVTVFSPDGQTNSGVLPAELLAAFDTSVHVYLGINPNGGDNIGQSAAFGNVSITGFGGVFNDNFVNLNNWTTSVAQDPAGVLFKPPGTQFRLSWPGPAAGFVLQFRPAFGGAPWMSANAPVGSVGSDNVAFVPMVGTSGFFRLAKP